MHSTAIADLAVVIAGIAVLIAVAALLISTETSKRLHIRVTEQLNETDVRLAAAIEKQDERLSTLRRVISDMAEGHDSAVRQTQMQVQDLRTSVALMGETVEELKRERKSLAEVHKFQPNVKAFRT